MKAVALFLLIMLLIVLRYQAVKDIPIQHRTDFDRLMYAPPHEDKIIMPSGPVLP